MVQKSLKNQRNLKKRYQIAFRRWLTEHLPGKGISKYIGADLPFVRKWLSDRFLPEMNWNNYGNVWVVDHLVPLHLFDFTNEGHLKLALHYKNLMPLLKEDNLYKEGSIGFSIEILNHIPPCEITEKLKEILLQEADRLKKYLPNQMVRAA